MDTAYEAWNAALVREYFPTGNRGRLAYLPIDDDELIALSAAEQLCEPGEAVAHFVAAVKAELAVKNGSFVRFANSTNWRAVRPQPPFIGAIALAVLAASRMQSDAQVASSNYYVQLNRLLGRPDSAGIPPGFDKFSSVWADLATWLDDDCAGDRGKSTARKANGLPYVGYPLSQALLRACDRRRLPDFFRVANLEPGLEVDESKLFVLLKAWSAQPSCGLTSGARAVIANAVDVDREEIAETVARELRAWDGELRDERGRRRATMHLRVIPRGRRSLVQLVARKPTGFPSGAWHTDPGGTVVHLEAHPASGDWYAPLDFRLTQKILETGLHLVRDDLALVLEPTDAVPCREAGPELNGGYLSAGQSVMWQPQHAVVRRELLPELRGYLEKWVDGEPAALVCQGLPDGWALTTQFRFVSAPTELPPVRFRRFAPRLLAATSLFGGLPLGGGKYLSGGEPDAQIALDESAQTSVTLDGKQLAIHSGTLTLSLSTMRLKPEEHELRADVSRRFTTVYSHGKTIPDDAASVASVYSRHTAFQAEGQGARSVEHPLPAGKVAIAGAVVIGAPADLPPAVPEAVLLRAGRERYCVIGRTPGELVEAARPRAPKWLRYVQLDSQFQFVELDVDFVPVWALTEAKDQTRQITFVGKTAPSAPNPLTRADMPREAWDAAILRWADATVDPGHLEHWTQYVKAARQADAEA